ncbi:MAG: sodium:calcium antiporter [Nitrospinota bacterium]|nr:MAG: sodium:calcium antiporter [Nitrospinota bacterium]
MPLLGMLLGGIGLLYLGAEWLVRGASTIALRLGVTPLVVGLTVVAFATSAPELLVSLLAALTEQQAISVGNVIGSNIFNLVILGIAALVRPLQITARTVRAEMPIAFLVSLGFWGLGWDGRIGRGDAVILLVCFLGFLWHCLKTARTEEVAMEGERGSPHPWLIATMGLGGLGLGAHLFVRGAVQVSRLLGVSELVIGLTVVAVGTSLPELVTSLIAAYRKVDDISVGNIVGSNIFNILLIVGGCALIRPLPVPPAVLRIDVPMMLATMLLAFPLMWSGLRLNRWEGIALIVAYAGYVFYLYQVGGSP